MPPRNDSSHRLKRELERLQSRIGTLEAAHREHRRTEETLRKHLTAMEASIDGMAIIDNHERFLYVNDALAKMYGYAAPRALVRKSWKTLFGNGERKRFSQKIVPALRKHGRWTGEAIGKRSDGTLFHQELALTLLEDGGLVCVVRDITERKQDQDALRKSERFLHTIFDSIHDPFCIIDRSYTVVRVNDAYARLKNRRADELTGRKCYEAIYGGRRVCRDCIMTMTFKSSLPCVKEKPVSMPDGSQGWVEIYTHPIISEKGAVTHVIEYTRNITERKKTDTEIRSLVGKLEHLSRTDSLTGLLNRRALLETLEYEIGRAQRYYHGLSLVLCDIDYFKEINDTLGHDTGDGVLKNIADALGRAVRKTDFVGRYGGDEFMIILPETEIADAEHLAKKISRLSEKIPLKKGKSASLRVTLSIGVASISPDCSAERVIKNADDALYASKREGRNTVTLSHPAINPVPASE